MPARAPFACSEPRREHTASRAPPRRSAPRETDCENPRKSTGNAPRNVQAPKSSAALTRNRCISWGFPTPPFSTLDRLSGSRPRCCKKNPRYGGDRPADRRWCAEVFLLPVIRSLLFLQHKGDRINIGSTHCRRRERGTQAESGLVDESWLYTSTCGVLFCIRCSFDQQTTHRRGRHAPAEDVGRRESPRQRK